MTLREFIAELNKIPAEHLDKRITAWVKAGPISGMVHIKPQEELYLDHLTDDEGVYIEISERGE